MSATDPSGIGPDESTAPDEPPRGPAATPVSAPVTTDVGEFAIVPLWLPAALLEANPGGTPAALMVWVVLHRWTGRRTLTAWPSQRAIAAQARYSVDTVQRAIRLLADVGALDVTGRTSAAGDLDTLVYHLRYASPTSTGSAMSRTDAQGLPHPRGEGLPHRRGEGLPHRRGTNREEVEREETPARKARNTTPTRPAGAAPPQAAAPTTPRDYEQENARSAVAGHLLTGDTPADTYTEVIATYPRQADAIIDEIRRSHPDWDWTPPASTPHLDAIHQAIRHNQPRPPR